MSEKQTSLQKKESQELVPLTGEVPAYIKNGGRGLEDVRKEDLVLPRIKLLQPLSPEVVDGVGKPGDLINSLTQENYGTEILFVPVKQGYNRMYWSSRTPGQNTEILCSSEDGKVPSTRVETPVSSACAGCPKAQFTNKNEPPQCTEFYNFVSFVNGSPVVLSMSRTQVAIAKKLISQLVYLARGGNFDSFAFKFKLQTGLVKGDKGSYYNYKIAGAGRASEDEYKRAEEFYTSMKERTVTVHAEDSAEG